MSLTPVETLSPAQVDRLVELYAGEWWTGGRRRADVVAMLEGSDVVLGLVTRQGELAGFARALTDGVFKALIFDVIVAPEHRGQGAGELMIRRLLDHPRLRRVRHKELYCRPEMVPFYARFGFTAETGGVLLLRATTP